MELRPWAENSIALSNGALAAAASCTITVNVVGVAGTQVNTTSAVGSTHGGSGNAATATITVRPLISGADLYQLDYVVNLNVGDGVINITNAGALGADAFGPFSFCRFIVGNGSGAGICKTCRLGGLGAAAK